MKIERKQKKKKHQNILGLGTNWYLAEIKTY